MSTGPPPEWHRTKAEIIAAGARRMELDVRARKAWAVKRPRQIDLAPTPRYRHPVTGRHELQAPPELVEIGRYFRRARRYTLMSQQRLAKRSGVSQSMISRFERGLAPAMGTRHIVAIAAVLGRIFPFGTCPHDHECAWQPFVPPPDAHISDIERWLAITLGTESASPEPNEQVERTPSPIPEQFISVTLDDLSVGSMDGPGE